MDWKSLIEQYLFEGSVQERKEKFEIAWEIWRNFETITYDMRRGVFKELKDLVMRLRKENAWRDYVIKDTGLLTGERYLGIVLYKSEWTIDNDYVVAYSIEPQKNHFLNEIKYGIKKFNDKKPFEGAWKETRPKGYEILERIKQILDGDYPNWEVHNWWWIALRCFDDPYCDLRPQKNKEFYKIILEHSENGLQEGYRRAAEYYYSRLVELKNSTESLLDDFVRLYKGSSDPP